MKIKYFATLRKITGKEEEDLNFRNVRDLLNYLLEKYGDNFKQSLYDGNSFKKGVIILKNGKNIIYLNDLDTELDEGDEVSIFPPVAGG